MRGLRFTFRRSVAACTPLELLLDADGLEELSVWIDFFRVTGTVHVSDSVSYRCGREFFCFSTLFSAYTAPVVLESGAAGRAVAASHAGVPASAAVRCNRIQIHTEHTARGGSGSPTPLTISLIAGPRRRASLREVSRPRLRLRETRESKVRDHA